MKQLLVTFIVAAIVSFCGGGSRKMPRGATNVIEPATAAFVNRDAGLASFYGKLAELQSGQRRRVRVFHFGDSVIMGERVARDIRRSLARDFGDGGRGQIVMDQGNVFLSDNQNLSRQNFDFITIPYNHFNHIDPKWLPDAGFTAWTYRARGPNQWSEQKLSAAMQPVSEVTIIARPARNAKDLRESLKIVNHESRPAQTQKEDFEIQKDGCTTRTIRFAPTRHLSVGFGDHRSALLDAVFLETASGVAYSTFIHRGRHMAWMTAITQGALECGYRAAEPDLLVFQFGINESASIDWKAFGFSAERYKAQMRSFFERIRAALPNVAILLIGPYERLKQTAAGYVSYPAMEQVINLQREISVEMNLAFFDSYAHFGGAGQMRRMIRDGLSYGDYSHLNDKGSQILGLEVYRQMKTGFGNY